MLRFISVQGSGCLGGQGFRCSFTVFSLFRVFGFLSVKGPGMGLGFRVDPLTHWFKGFPQRVQIYCHHGIRSQKTIPILILGT